MDEQSQFQFKCVYVSRRLYVNTRQLLNNNDCSSSHGLLAFRCQAWTLISIGAVENDKKHDDLSEWDPWV